MIREVDLVSYLPEFMKTYKEPIAALEAENPEFADMWNKVDKVLYNRFISTADEYGISRFEKMMGIYPEENDTLETRRFKVLLKWNDKLPYTVKTLKDLLVSLCGENGYTLKITDYEVTVKLALSDESIIQSVIDMLDKVLPVNLAKNVTMFNTHSVLEDFTYGQLSLYTNKEIREAVLE